MNRFLAYFGTAALGIAASAMGSTIYPANNGFELPDLGSGSNAYQYPGHGGAPTLVQQGGSGWTFTGGAGIAANLSAFNLSGATNGNSGGAVSTAGQAGILQNGDGTLAGTSITQSVNGIAAGTLQIVFAAENRPYQGGTTNVSVYLDGVLVDTVIPPTSSFQNYATLAIPVTAGSHTIGFAGGPPTTSDQTAFVDNVGLINVPEPASIGLLGCGGLGLLARRRRA